MHIKRFLIVLITVLVCSGTLHAQKQATDAVQLQGEWQMEKVVTKLFAQKDNRLLEERTYTTQEELSRVNAVIPVRIKFTAADCIMMHRSGIDSAKYQVPVNGMLRVRRVLPGFQAAKARPEPHITYTYELLQPAALALHMPASNYQDNTSNLAVKLVYTCYYQKKP